MKADFFFPRATVTILRRGSFGSRSGPSFAGRNFIGEGEGDAVTGSANVEPRDFEDRNDRPANTAGDARARCLKEIDGQPRWSMQGQADRKKGGSYFAASPLGVTRSGASGAARKNRGGLVLEIRTAKG